MLPCLNIMLYFHVRSQSISYIFILVNPTHVTVLSVKKNIGAIEHCSLEFSRDLNINLISYFDSCILSMHDKRWSMMLF